jgi:hypothetical protein
MIRSRNTTGQRANRVRLLNSEDRGKSMSVDLTDPIRPVLVSRFFRLSTATTQLPQQPAVMFSRTDIRSWRQRGGYFHTGSEILAPRLARRCFLITSCRFARRAATRWYGGYNAFEHDCASSKGYGVSGFERARGLHTLAIEVDSTAADRIGRGATGLEQSDAEQPAINPHVARPCLFHVTHGHRV